MILGKLGQKLISIERQDFKNLFGFEGVKSGLDRFHIAPPLEEDVVQINSKVIRRFTGEEIEQAYKTYAKSPYINSYLRDSIPLSPENEQLVRCLKQAIHSSEPITGKYVRGLTFNRKTPLTEENIKRFLFNNKGFSSACPKENERYAQTFAIGKNSAVVEIELKHPIPAYRASNYEVIFDTNAFTPEQYELIKINENYYKLLQK